jgi:hypothetical protein
MEHVKKHFEKIGQLLNFELIRKQPLRRSPNWFDDVQC